MICFSLDTFDSKAYEVSRIGATFETTRDNIKTFSKKLHIEKDCGGLARRTQKEEEETILRKQWENAKFEYSSHALAEML